MTAVQLFCILSTMFAVFVGTMVSSGSTIGLMLKSIAWCLAVFGAFVTGGTFGLVLANGARLV